MQRVHHDSDPRSISVPFSDRMELYLDKGQSESLKIPEATINRVVSVLGTKVMPIRQLPGLCTPDVKYKAIEPPGHCREISWSRSTNKLLSNRELQIIQPLLNTHNYSPKKPASIFIMCYQVCNYDCPHISRVQVECQRFDERRKACLRPLLNWLCPVKICQETIEGVRRPGKPCNPCRAKLLEQSLEPQVPSDISREV